MNDTKPGEKVPLTAAAAIKPFATKRKDAWWLEPTLVAVGFLLFILYATYRAWAGQYYEVDNILSPFYSPKIPVPEALASIPILGKTFSPAFLILWMPAGFRATCYYYRKAYYRAYFADPPACGVGHMGGEKYCGESTWPLVIQNVHRYMLYLAVLVLGVLWWDAFQSLSLDGSFRLGVASVIMFANCTLLSAYTFGCHALRHLVGGRLDCFSCSSNAKAQYGIWKFVSKLNEHHMLWAWLSLFSVGFTDFYISQVAMHHFVPTAGFADATLFGPNLPEHFVK
jgi:hypothetical protein